MADSGKIDRKSLFEYKSRLSSQFGTTLVDTYNHLDLNNKNLSFIEEEVINKVFFYSDNNEYLDIAIEYPQFLSISLDRLNFEALSLVKKEAEELINYANNKKDFFNLPYYLTGKYIITISNSHITSLRYRFSSYTGGAHGNNYTNVLTFNKKNQSIIHLHELFHDSDYAMHVISNYCIATLKQSEYCSDETNVKHGAGPNLENYKLYNFTPNGIVFTFEEYQVACYAVGKQEVLVPYSLLENISSDLLNNIIFQTSK